MKYQLSETLYEKTIRNREYEAGDRPVCKKKCDCLECKDRIMLMIKENQIYSLKEFTK